MMKITQVISYDSSQTQTKEGTAIGQRYCVGGGMASAPNNSVVEAICLLT